MTTQEIFNYVNLLTQGKSVALNKQTEILESILGLQSQLIQLVRGQQVCSPETINEAIASLKVADSVKSKSVKSVLDLLDKKVFSKTLSINGYRVNFKEVPIVNVKFNADLVLATAGVVKQDFLDLFNKQVKPGFENVIKDPALAVNPKGVEAAINAGLLDQSVKELKNSTTISVEIKQ